MRYIICSCIKSNLMKRCLRQDELLFLQMNMNYHGRAVPKFSYYLYQKRLTLLRRWNSYVFSTVSKYIFGESRSWFESIFIYLTRGTKKATLIFMLDNEKSSSYNLLCYRVLLCRLVNTEVDYAMEKRVI